MFVQADIFDAASRHTRWTPLSTAPVTTTESFARPSSSSSHPTPSPESPGKWVTELVLGDFSADNIASFAPMFGHLSHHCHERWFTWIGNRQSFMRLRDPANFAPGNTRTLLCDDTDSTINLLWEALMAGTSDAVIALVPKLPDAAIDHFEAAAARHATRCLLVRVR